MMYAHPSLKTDFSIAEKGIESRRVLPELIDYTLLKPESTESQFKSLCGLAKEKQFATVCVPPCRVKLCKEVLDALKAKVRICTVVGFPLGYSTPEIKCAEIKDAIKNGAEEIDFVQNVGLVKEASWDELEREYRTIVDSVKSTGKLVKCILETSLLADHEIEECSYKAATCGVHVIKTSSGYGKRGASVDDIKAIKNGLKRFTDKCGVTCGIKASGGIRDSSFALSLIESGATRIGTSCSTLTEQANTKTT
eukprot:Nk52_evm8s2604 gene=Nk52_evmTU8s2604